MKLYEGAFLPSFQWPQPKPDSEEASEEEGLCSTFKKLKNWALRQKPKHVGVWVAFVFFYSDGRKSCKCVWRIIFCWCGFVKLYAVFSLFILERERARERESARVRVCAGWGGAEREGERIPSGLCAVSIEPYTGLDPTNCEIVTYAEIKSQPLNWLSHPSPTVFIY